MILMQPRKLSKKSTPRILYDVNGVAMEPRAIATNIDMGTHFDDMGTHVMKRGTHIDIGAPNGSHPSYLLQCKWVSAKESG